MTNETPSDDEDLDRITELNALGTTLTDLAEAHLKKASGLRGKRLRWRSIGRAEGLTEAFKKLQTLESRWLAESRNRRGLP